MKTILKTIFKLVYYVFIWIWVMLLFIFSFSSLFGLVAGSGVIGSADHLSGAMLSFLVVTVLFLIHRRSVLNVIEFCLTFGYLGFSLFHAFLALIPTFLLLPRLQNIGTNLETVMFFVLFLVFIFVSGPIYRGIVRWFLKKKKSLLKEKQVKEPIIYHQKKKKKRHKKRIS
ncbi:hypothetical protein [Mesobacillus jeotgali]|uniref:Uncharacterized protein n=1 Tax=Mesobacillus jeotgali TaxID=129985 RepID=A0ABY9VQB9_9BACI|nr:hypothetical protein [Mesobacillus jeotgali]WNF24850.1 hypothetical protein RH061_10340 [Mesobacillus jeotgali]